MFSPRERDFLEVIGAGDGASVERRLAAAFPNPVYRRKLVWGIRHKAERCSSDWKLLFEAARRDERLLPAPTASPSEAPPLFADSVVSLLELLHRRWPRRAAGHGAASPKSGQRE
jgi:hypothetical protein